MSDNNDHIAGIHPLYPQGTNSTMFTLCCGIAICDNQPNCPHCGCKVIGWDAESIHERGRIRWKSAYQKPIKKALEEKWEK